ncbi:MAG: hypothetical protein HC773_05185 [Scytonema sp. CRU_2_7]|nr:hypothetical protein [Scytonema sp. CRU_2_7]
MVIIMSVILASIGPLLVLVGTLASAILFLTATAHSLNIALIPIIGTIALVVLAIAGISLAIYLLIDDFNTWRANGDSVLGSLLGRFESFKNGIMKVINSIKQIWTTFWTALSSNSEADWNKFIDAIVNSLSILTTAFGKLWSKIIDLSIKALSGFVNLLGTLIYNAITTAIKGALGALGFVGTLVNRMFGGKKDDKTGQQKPSGFVNAVQGFGNTLFNPAVAIVIYRLSRGQ